MRLSRTSRHGAVVPTVAVCLIGLMGFVALAVDIGLMVIARSQAQNAADIAALAGARTLDGKTSNNNTTAAMAEAREAAQSNYILNGQIAAGQVAGVQAGVYRYDGSAQRFQAVFDSPPGSTEAYGAMQVTIVSQQSTVFAKVLGIQSVTVSAQATAVHRPRDVAIVLDLSGSMNYCSQAGYPLTNLWSAVTGSLNPDPDFPRFGPWSIWGGAGMVLDPVSPGSTPANLTSYVPPTPMQRVFPYIDFDGQVYAMNNMTTATRNGPAIVDNFVQADNGTKAFVRVGAFPTFTNVNVSTSGNPTGIITPAPATFANQNASGFAGDKFPLRSGVTVGGTTAPTPDQYAHTAADVVGVARTTVTATTRSVPFETNGYDWDFGTGVLKPAAQRFQGFTTGPGYYGKTFYMWPPDARAPVGQIGDTSYKAGDWRRRFFSARAGSAQDTRDNSMFWESTGKWKVQAPGGNAAFVVNYDNVLKWLKRGPQTLPSSLRSGRVVYYDAIPDSVPVDAATGLVAAGATVEQRFWKDYIDFVVGAGRYPADNAMFGGNSSNRNTRAGANLAYNNPSSTNLAPKITPRSTLVAAAGANPVPYMAYDDSPIHPRAQFWFGPQSMLAFLQIRKAFSGTCYEAPCWQLKVGIKAAIDDIKNNHPNDLASLNFFSGSQNYNTVRVGMGKDYAKMQNALFYPFTLLDTLSNPASVYPAFSSGWIDTNNSPSGLHFGGDTIIPNAGTDTCPQMGFMVAFNELGNAVGSTKTHTGRRGASKLVIFETDGVPNGTCQGTLVKTGDGSAGRWYYDSIGSISTTGNSTVFRAPPKDNARAVVRQIVAMDTDGVPGYSTARNPARVHAIAFGELFESSTPSAMQPTALRFLAAVQIDGKTTPAPGSGWDTESLDYQSLYVNREPFKIITGNYDERIDKIRKAMERIMQGGVQVALIQ